MANNKLWEIIKKIKNGNMSLEESKAYLSEDEWDKLSYVFEIAPRLVEYPWTGKIADLQLEKY